MLEARLKLSVMRTCRCIAYLALTLVLMGAAANRAASARDLTFVSPEAALEQGTAAYRGGYYDIAVPALEYAADKGMFFGRYYLAQVYADDNAAYTNHGKAYQIFLQIAEEHASVDPDDDARAPYVAKSLYAVAKYVRRGLEPIGLKPNAERAAEFFRAAATYFRDRDAQFELAKMYLKGEGVDEDRSLAFHWLSTLTQEGHAGAQAFLADQLWRGKELARDERRALALITVAVANAPAADRIWIEDIYQNIFCGSSAGTRQQADGLVAVWKRIYAPKTPTEDNDRMALAAADRQCSNGEALPMPRRSGQLVDSVQASRDSGFMQGNAVPGTATSPIRGAGERR
jgi:TPR repeat protein